MFIKGKLSLKERLNKGKCLFGTFIKLNCPEILEMIGRCNFDFIIVDGRHSPFSYKEMQQLVRTANGIALPAMIRLPANKEDEILHSIDIGAQGIVTANVKSIDEWRYLAEYIKYRPTGKLDFALTTRAGGYCAIESSAYIQYINTVFLSLFTIGSLNLAGRIKELCDVDAVDVIFIGVESLSIEIGKYGKTDDPEVLAIVRGITETALSHGKQVGVYASTIAEVTLYTEWGIQIIVYGSDALTISKMYLEESEGLCKIRESV